MRARMPARAAASTWLRISASSGETITVGPLPALAQQRRRDEVDRGLAPARALHDQGAALVGDQCLDRPPLVLAQPGRARGVPDEAGQDGIGCGTQICVAHALHASHDNARRPEARTSRPEHGVAGVRRLSGSRAMSLHSDH